MIINNKEISATELQTIANECSDKTTFAKALGFGYLNGRITKRLKEIVSVCNLDIKHFDSHLKNRQRCKFEIAIQEVLCTFCKKPFMKESCQMLSKVGSNFCSRSCSASFNNRNKKYGLRRSKMEVFIEERLKQDFGDLLYLTSNKSVIGSELDFYFPSLKLAVEVNGILHYEPIYGQKTFDRIQMMDEEKRVNCESNGINLFVLNCKDDRYLKQELKEKRYQEVKEVIMKHI